VSQSAPAYRGATGNRAIQERRAGMSDEDRRVQFDFDISFTNGGGIQGQGFRLDIVGDDVADEALAAAIVRDMRLLMVGEVKILNKQIIRERHKRRADEAPAAQAPEGRRIVDLSHEIEDGMVTYPGLPAPRISELLTREASRSQYAPGTEFQISQIDICASTGSYLDSPFHRYADGADLSALPLERLADLDAVIVDVSGSATRAVDAAQLMPYDVAGRAVLVHTGWDRHWRTEAYAGEHPFLTAAAAEHLARHGAALVGVDSVNVDDTSDPSRPAHSILLGAGIAICEHLTNLGELPAEGARFTAAPLKIIGVGSFPVRAFALM
jgi:arylformamidase